MIAPDAEEMRAMAGAARAGFPPPFAGLAADVRLIVEEWPEETLLDEMQIDDGYDLTGAYEGEPLPDRSVDMPSQPSVVTLFRRPILDEWAARGDVTVAALVAHVTVHEFAHHFGWSDADIARIDEWWT